MADVDAFGIPRDRCISFGELRGAGATRAQIRHAVRGGWLRHARRDVYLSAGVPEPVFRAQRVGGRLDCVSALELMGVYVRKRSRLHVQVEPRHARLRSPLSRRQKLGTDGASAVVHWRDLRGDEHTVDPASAIVQSFGCQEPRQVVASIDSAVHLGIIDQDDVDEMFARVPRRFRRLHRLVDGRAGSGPETLARLLVRQFGRSVEVQKTIAGVRRVDLDVDGWIVIECDGRAHHSGWPPQEHDRLRDLALAAQGYVCIRPTANMILTTPRVLTDAVRALLALRR